VRPTHHQVPQIPPAMQQQQQQQQQHAPAYETMKLAPLVKSLVAVHRGRCVLEHDDQGVHLKVFIMASAPGEAIAYFQAEGASDTELEVLSAKQVSRERFSIGKDQEVRFLLTTQDLRKSLEGFTEGGGKYNLLLDLRAESAEPNAVTVQRSEIKLAQEGDSIHLGKQWVMCGKIVRSLEALYGTLPNPKGIAEGASSEMDGGDCVICLSKPRDVAILHCRHVCLCSACAKITSSTWSFQCPVCRGRVAAMVGLDELASQG